MALYIFLLVFMFSLSGILYLMVRALPRIADEPSPEKRGLLDRWAHSDIPEKIDAAWNSFWFKFLRRLKIAALKFDNAVTKGLHRANTQDKAKAIDFKEISGQNKEGPEPQKEK